MKKQSKQSKQLKGNKKHTKSTTRKQTRTNKKTPKKQQTKRKTSRRHTSKKHLKTKRKQKGSGWNPFKGLFGNKSSVSPSSESSSSSYVNPIQTRPLPSPPSNSNSNSTSTSNSTSNPTYNHLKREKSTSIEDVNREIGTIEQKISDLNGKLETLKRRRDAMISNTYNSPSTDGTIEEEEEDPLPPLPPAVSEGEYDGPNQGNLYAVPNVKGDPSAPGNSPA